MSHFSLYAIYGIARGEVLGERFDVSRLPFEIVPGVCIEDVSKCIREDEFKYVEKNLGSRAVGDLKDVHYALVHRFDGQATFESSGMIPEHKHVENSEVMLRNLNACLRLIRPMRQTVSHMTGTFREDGTFNISSFNSSIEMMEVPQVHKLFLLRDQDADDLRTYAPLFLNAMKGCWKFMMAAQYHELGYWQLDQFRKSRYMLWSSAIESIYTTQDRQHRGGVVGKARIKWFLGENTSIYDDGDIPDTLEQPDPPITIGNVVDDLYSVRNILAHGGRILDKYGETLRQGLNGPLTIYDVLFEAQSFIIRKSLLKILRERLTPDFADDTPAQAYFARNNLTLNNIIRSQRA